MDKLEVSLFYNFTKVVMHICVPATQLHLIFVQALKISAKKACEDPGLPNILNSLLRCFKLSHSSALFTLGDDASLTDNNNPKLNCLAKKYNSVIVILTQMLLKKNPQF